MMQPIITPILMSMLGKSLGSFKIKFMKEFYFASFLCISNHFLSLKNYEFLRVLRDILRLNNGEFGRNARLRVFIFSGYLLRITYDLVIHGHTNFEGHLHVKIKRVRDEHMREKIQEVPPVDSKKTQ